VSHKLTHARIHAQGVGFRATHSRACTNKWDYNKWDYNKWDYNKWDYNKWDYKSPEHKHKHIHVYERVLIRHTRPVLTVHASDTHVQSSQFMPESLHTQANACTHTRTHARTHARTPHLRFGHVEVQGGML